MKFFKNCLSVIQFIIPNFRLLVDPSNMDSSDSEDEHSQPEYSRFSMNSSRANDSINQSRTMDSTADESMIVIRRKKAKQRVLDSDSDSDSDSTSKSTSDRQSDDENDTDDENNSFNRNKSKEEENSIEQNESETGETSETLNQSNRSNFSARKSNDESPNVSNQSDAMSKSLYRTQNDDSILIPQNTSVCLMLNLGMKRLNL